MGGEAIPTSRKNKTYTREALKAAIVSAGLLAVPDGAQAQSADAPQVEADAGMQYYIDREFQRPTVRGVLKVKPDSAPLFKGQSLDWKSESQSALRSWLSLYGVLEKGLGQRYEMGGVHAGSSELQKGISRRGNRRKSDVFEVTAELIWPLFDELKRLHELNPGTTPFDMCIVHTHPRTLKGLPIARVLSLPPSAADLKDVVDPGLTDDMEKYIGRKIAYREAVIDTVGMWVFEGVHVDSPGGLNTQTAAQIYEAQVRWARYVASGESRGADELRNTPQFDELRAQYRAFGVDLSYYTHAEARTMPLCKVSK